MNKLFKSWKWYELLFLGISELTIILCFVFSVDKNWLSLVNSLIGVFAVLTVAKGLVYAPIVNIVYTGFYIALSISQSYWGEVIICVCLAFPMCIVAIITWLKNRSNENKDIVKINSIKGKEYGYLALGTAVLTVALYFLLRALNTNQLIISTISLVTSAAAEYLLLRRSPIYALGFVLNDIVLITLWSMSVVSEGLQFLPSVICFCVFFFNDLYGFFNWIKEYKKQKAQTNNIENKNESESEKPKSKNSKKTDKKAK